MTELAGGSADRSSTWANVVRAIAILVPVVAAIPTAFDLYTAIKQDIPFWEVRWRLKQGELSQRNWDCQPHMKYEQLANLGAGASGEEAEAQFAQKRQAPLVVGQAGACLVRGEIGGRSAKLRPVSAQAVPGLGDRLPLPPGTHHRAVRRLLLEHEHLYVSRQHHDR